MAKSIKQQIIDLEEVSSKALIKIEELKVQLASEISEDKLTPGTNIVFVYGKGDTKRDLTGQIVGVKLPDPADKKATLWLNVAVGEGFEAQLVKVSPAAVKQIVAGEPQPEPTAA